MIYNLPFELDSQPDKEYEADLKIIYNAYYDGLGWYDWWGSKCFDKGKLTIEIENYTILSIYLDGEKLEKQKITNEMLDSIDRKFYLNSTQENIRIEILENLD